MQFQPIDVLLLFDWPDSTDSSATFPASGVPDFREFHSEIDELPQQCDPGGPADHLRVDTRLNSPPHR